MDHQVQGRRPKSFGILTNVVGDWRLIKRMKRGVPYLKVTLQKESEDWAIRHLKYTHLNRSSSDCLKKLSEMFTIEITSLRDKNQTSSSQPCISRDCTL